MLVVSYTFKSRNSSNDELDGGRMDLLMFGYHGTHAGFEAEQDTSGVVPDNLALSQPCRHCSLCHQVCRAVPFVPHSAGQHGPLPRPRRRRHDLGGVPVAHSHQPRVAAVGKSDSLPSVGMFIYFTFSDFGCVRSLVARFILSSSSFGAPLVFTKP